MYSLRLLKHRWGGGKHNTVMNTYRYTCNSCLCWYKCTHTHIYIPGRVAYRDTLQGLIGWQHFKSEIQGTVGQTTFSSALDIKTHLRWTWLYLILWYSFIGFYSFSFYLTWMYEWIWMNNELCSTPNVFFFLQSYYGCWERNVAPPLRSRL